MADLDYYAKRGYLGREKVIEANTPQPAANVQVQENLSQVAQSVGGAGIAPKPMQGAQFQTNVEADERARIFNERLEQMQGSPEEKAKIRARFEGAE